MHLKRNLDPLLEWAPIHDEEQVVGAAIDSYRFQAADCSQQMWEYLNVKIV